MPRTPPPSRQLDFDESVVILTGRLSSGEIKRLFVDEGLRLELHDRDRLPHDRDLDVMWKKGGGDEEFADFDTAVGVSGSLSLISQHRTSIGSDCVCVAQVLFWPLLP